MKTYDILDAGPNNRFTANGRVVSNSGSILQPQNLPQNHLPDLSLARDTVKSGDYELLDILYGNVPTVLSELIRTVLIPKSEHRFIVADFSAIEARVLAWLAGENWRIDTFRNGGDIYCASASKMFGVPVVKHGENSHLRQKGKIAELACIAEDELVLTDKGLVPIQNVTTEHSVWDGENWVKHEGVIFKGYKEVIEYDGLRATPDHLVYYMDKIMPFGDVAKEIKVKDVVPVYDIRNAGEKHRFTVSGKLVHNCGYGGSVGALKSMGAIEMGISEDELQGIIDDWRSANPNIVKLWYDVGNAAMKAVKERTTVPLGKLKFIYKSGILFIQLPSGRRLSYIKPQIGTNRFGGESITYMGISAAKKWDRLETFGGKIVENCTQAIARDLLANAMMNVTAAGYDIVFHVHDEIIAEMKNGVGSVDEMCSLMCDKPQWADGLPLNADGYECEFYKKD